ncbi:MAG: RagB/SusD family nutrient uptake outer membrane protein [Massilibacteroides sp.]|nr:RagB/SusD family nutrient uptake outer membrane protein [Massilibacteroides sp.]
MKMIYKKYCNPKKILIFCVILSFFSCNNDFLDCSPFGVLDEDTYLSTEDAGYKLLVNCYQPITNNWSYQTMKFDIGDQITDDCTKGGSDAGDRSAITDIVKGSPLASNSTLTQLWDHRFKDAISPCNVLLNVITPDKILIQNGGSFVNNNTKLRWIAETHFLRAFYYFDLAMVFGNVPIIDKPLKSVDKNTIKKVEKDQVKDFILSDLTLAINETNIPSAKNLPSSEIGRVTKEAVLAFRARVQLFYGDYENAKTDLKKVIDSGSYGLVDNYETLFNSALEGYMSKESVFVTLRSYISNYTGGSVCPQMNVGRGATGGWGGQCPTYDLVDEYEIGDPRLVHSVLSSGDIFIKPDGTEEIHDYSGYDNFTQQHSRKQYPTWERRAMNNLMSSDWTFYHIRYADVLLMYAECLIETGDDKQKAVDIINQIRHRAFVTTSPIDTYSKSRKFNIPEDERVSEEKFNTSYKVKLSDDLRAAIRHERRVEFAGEGMRFYDLLRWNIFVPTMQALAKTPEGKYSSAGLLVTDKTWPYPIPQNEIDYVGGSLTQNDNY